MHCSAVAIGVELAVEELSVLSFLVVVVVTADAVPAEHEVAVEQGLVAVVAVEQGLVAVVAARADMAVHCVSVTVVVVGVEIVAEHLAAGASVVAVAKIEDLIEHSCAVADLAVSDCHCDPVLVETLVLMMVAPIRRPFPERSEIAATTTIAGATYVTCFQIDFSLPMCFAKISTGFSVIILPPLLQRLHRWHSLGLVVGLLQGVPLHRH